ncbi:MAG: tRNA (adenosine(37)-N6)-threonylcarbamoyltransferase complex dimerization subunit type 1 TsaB [Lachnospiraceae bacterium]|nr:tRNA (adenosine(37)-N6)-threonylcarbamoyltransferase complex dimerization subunit type 1 TsaB [Lachnospiraceae bacterium]
MKIIAIDSSGLVATVAIASEDTLIAEYTVNHKKTHSQTLLPMLDEIKKMTELDLATVDAVAVAAGPGSFTGLRIGSATAKGLALALEKPVIEVPTVDALAMNMWGTRDIVCPIMDARREQVYTGFYTFDEDDELTVIRERFADDIVNVVGMLAGYGKQVTFLGDGVPVYRETIEKNITVPYRFAPFHMNRQRAGAVALLAVRYYREGKTVSAAEHKPDYLRLSQAEQNDQNKKND